MERGDRKFRVSDAACGFFRGFLSLLLAKKGQMRDVRKKLLFLLQHGRTISFKLLIHKRSFVLDKSTAEVYYEHHL